MIRWQLILALGLGQLAAGCDAGATDEPACDATTCAEREGGSSPPGAQPADPDDAAVPVTPSDTDSGPVATDASAPASDAGDASTQTPPAACGDDDDCAPPDDPAPCANGELDDGETDLDCGGECGGCGPEQACVVDDDCAGMDCTLELCVPNCADDVQNQGESDVDCGQACPGTPCEDGDDCTAHADCESDFCHPTSAQCATPSCSDGVENGTESQVDCGGTTSGVICPACPVGCTDNWECDGISAGGAGAGICYDGFCVDDVHGCTVANSVDFLNMVTASQSAPITIDFGGALGTAYSPRCIKVTMGTKLRFEGAFASHPLRGGLADGTEQPASTGPFTSTTDTGTSHDFTMGDCAAYPYYCENHGLSGMTGAVIVLLP